MSGETIHWLNQNTLFGFTHDKDIWAQGWGRFGDDGFSAWWQREGYTGAFPGPVPLEAVMSRLFFWKPQECAINVELACDDIELADSINDDGIVRPDTEQVLGIFGADSYQVHDYEQWLITNVATILDASEGELGISSAGLLRGGGVAYVTIEAPDTVMLGDADGVRPAIVAATSLDGTKATTYAIRLMRPICDNSLDYALKGDHQRVKIRHSSKSLNRIGDVREQLGVFWETAEDMVTFMERCADTTVTRPDRRRDHTDPRSRARRQGQRHEPAGDHERQQPPR
jgi:phage/plasmid-like protein (TIGR03299 family)